MPRHLLPRKCLPRFLLLGLMVSVVIILCFYYELERVNQLPKRKIINRRARPHHNPELYQIVENYGLERLATDSTDPSFKKILFWNVGYGNKEYGVGFGRGLLKKFDCPVWQCDTSAERSKVDEYDAIVFHLRTWTIRDPPYRRSPHQRYVFWSIESPAWKFVDTNLMTDFFNWTMTYRWDSDMVFPYGYIVPIDDVPLHPNEGQLKNYISTMDATLNYAEGKTKMAVWFVSNCNSVHSRRNEMVAELKKVIDVDIVTMRFS